VKLAFGCMLFKVFRPMCEGGATYRNDPGLKFGDVRGPLMKGSETYV